MHALCGRASSAVLSLIQNVIINRLTDLLQLVDKEETSPGLSCWDYKTNC